METRINLNLKGKNKKRRFSRRSLLFLPALNPNCYEKAISGEADSIIFDLEDSISISGKGIARENLSKFFPRDYKGKKELIIRINNTRSDFYKEDLNLVLKLKPNTICLPKVEDPKEIKDLENILKKCKSFDKGPIEVLVIIETSKGYLNAREILSSSKIINGTLLGVEDLVSQFKIKRKKLWEMPLISHMIAELAVIAAGCKVNYFGPVVRGYKNKKQKKILKQESLYMRNLKAVGMGAIHPNQLKIINKIFTDLPENFETKEIRKKLDEAEKKGYSVIGFKGEMIERNSSSNMP